MNATQRTAHISPCRQYRYQLTRRWARGGPIATIIMLNPSTADDQVDDPTIRRCVSFAQSWGASALSVVNLFAYRATDPRELARATDPVGPDNDAWLTTAATEAFLTGGPLVAAWGAHALARDRVATVLGLPGMRQLQALGITKSGAPRHPLYLRTRAELTPWPPAVGDDT